MIYINLLPVRANQKREKLIEQGIILGVAVALVFAACAGIYGVIVSKVLLEKSDIAKKEKKIQALQGQIKEVKNFEKLQKDLRVKLDILDKLKAGRSGPVHVLDELANAVPRTVWLDSFKISGSSCTVSGQALSEEGVAAFLQNLEASPYIKNVDLKIVDQTVRSKMTVKKFDVSFAVEDSPKSNVTSTKSSRP